MNIILNNNLNYLIDNKSVLFKGQDIYISTFNYDVFLEIIKEKRKKDYETYLNNSIYKHAINFIIMKNKENSISINELFFHILETPLEVLKEVGKQSVDNLMNSIKNEDLIIDDYKGLLFLTDNFVDYNLIFESNKNLEYLFIYDKKTKRLKVINRNLDILAYHNNLEEEDLEKTIKKVGKKLLKESENRLINKNLENLLNKYLNRDDFADDFLDEISISIANLIIKATKEELNERNLEILEKEFIEKNRKLGKNINIEELLTKTLLRKEKEKGINLEGEK